ncbi:MAG: GAF domain-containing protein [Salibacteraceae bacterium]
MAESLFVDQHASKAEKYHALLPQLQALVAGETDLIAGIANLMAGLKTGMGFFWVGVYFVKNDQLVLGPFQGPVACTRIGFGQGVCGSAWQQAQTIVVKDVEQFPGHIACSSDSKSEIVLPAQGPDGRVALVLDVDSDRLADFDETDQQALEQVIALIEDLLKA